MKPDKYWGNVIEHIIAVHISVFESEMCAFENSLIRMPPNIRSNRCFEKRNVFGYRCRGWNKQIKIRRSPLHNLFLWLTCTNPGWLLAMVAGWYSIPFFRVDNAIMVSRPPIEFQPMDYSIFLHRVALNPRITDARFSDCGLNALVRQLSYFGRFKIHRIGMITNGIHPIQTGNVSIFTPIFIGDIIIRQHLYWP